MVVLRTENSDFKNKDAIQSDAYRLVLNHIRGSAHSGGFAFGGLPIGVSAYRWGVCLPMVLWEDMPPLCHTDTCENITFPQLRLWTVKILTNTLKLFLDQSEVNSSPAICLRWWEINYKIKEPQAFSRKHSMWNVLHNAVSESHFLCSLFFL